ncbi:hypothetical protein COCVIDRAFT_89208, partial [Bipolaris victoriae FI3]
PPIVDYLHMEEEEKKCTFSLSPTPRDRLARKPRYLGTKGYPHLAPLPYPPPSLCFNHAPMGCPGNRKKVLGQAGLMNDISWPFHVCMSFSLVLSFSAVFFAGFPNPRLSGFSEGEDMGMVLVS